MRKNVASQVVGAQMVSATDGSAFTGSVTCSVTLDGGTQATGSVGSGACTHEGNGYHTYAPSQAETNGNLLAYTFTGSGAVPVTVQIFTVGYDPYQAQVPANVTQFGGSNGTFSGGRPEVNTTHWGGTAVASARPLVDVAQISGDSAAADNLEAAADGTGYNLGGGSIVAASVTGAVGSVTGNVGGNVTGSVGSVTGAVGSVTGNVGGNVVGSVGSVATGGIAATSIADGALTAAKFAAGAFDAVWSVATRLLTAGTNIVLAKGTGVTGFNDLDAAGVRSAVGLAAANLDAQLAAILDDTGEIGAAGAGLTEAGGTGDQFTAVLARLVALTVATGSVQDNVANTATAFETDLAETADHHWRDAFVLITSGALSGQVKRITAYDGTTKVLTVAGGFTAAPATAVTFAIINR